MATRTDYYLDVKAEATPGGYCVSASVEALVCDGDGDHKARMVKIGGPSTYGLLSGVQLPSGIATMQERIYEIGVDGLTKEQVVKLLTNGYVETDVPHEEVG